MSLKTEDDTQHSVSQCSHPGWESPELVMAQSYDDKQAAHLWTRPGSVHGISENLFMISSLLPSHQMTAIVSP